MNTTSILSTFDFKIATLIFLTYIIVGWMSAYYILRVTKRKAYSAATIGSLVYILMAVGVLNYVQNFLYLIPLGLGSWVGTFIVVKRK